MELVHAICDFVFGSAGSFVFGLAVGVAIVSGLWIRDIEKPWRPTDDEAVEAWEIVTGRDAQKTGKRDEIIRMSRAWADGWREALGNKNDDEAK